MHSRILLERGNMRFLQLSYKIVIIWAVISLVVFSLIQEWGLVEYVILFVGFFGSISYRYRVPLGNILRGLGFDNNFLYGLLVVSLVFIEEGLVYFFTGVKGIMNENLAVNMVLISVFWLSWLLTWKLFIAKKYHFTEQEAILTAGFAGIWYEIIGPGKFLDIGSVLFMTPLSILIYATVAIFPMQLVSFVGKQTSNMKYLAATIIPFIFTWPPALLLYIVFKRMGYL